MTEQGFFGRLLGKGAEQGIVVKQQPKDKIHVASTTVATGEGQGFWVSTVRLYGRFETLVFPEPRASLEDYLQVERPDISPYNLTNLPSVRVAKGNHTKAVRAAVRALQTA